MTTPKLYIVKIRRLKSGTYGKTVYQYSTKIKATLFAAGYQAALHDVGQLDIYVSVWEVLARTGGNAVLVVDTDQLKRIAEREC